MTSGVYLLKFKDGSTYIGKSNDIRRRLIEHITKLQRGQGAKALQLAFNAYGSPDYTILMECHQDHIDLMETFYIKALHPNLNSAATTPITDSEYEVLRNSFSELNLSTCQHIDLIKAKTSEIARLNEKVELLSRRRSKAEMAMSLRSRLKYLELENINLREQVAKLQKPWWKRIF